MARHSVTFSQKVTEVTNRTCFLQKMTTGRDNPYLAHLPPSQRGAGVSVDPTAKEPLYGFLPRKVTGPQVLKAMASCFYFPCSYLEFLKAETLIQKDGDINPFTKQPHSSQYKKILESRKKLPVFNQMEEFMDIVSFYWVSPKT